MSLFRYYEQSLYCEHKLTMFTKYFAHSQNFINIDEIVTVFQKKETKVAITQNWLFVDGALWLWKAELSSDVYWREFHFSGSLVNPLST